ncbi:hypothetical protein QE152_g15787 [Popillia japonica]|uniref:RES domain-containing protein n=1 Tax=Popillia japonica TaxID=7064 RepID=A0AAW1L6S6_POPJA
MIETAGIRKETMNLNTPDAASNPSTVPVVRKGSPYKNCQRVIYGTAQTDCTIKAVARYAHLHVSSYRLDPSLTVEELDNYLKSRNILNAKLEKLQSKRPDEYSSFRVSVPMDVIEDVKNPATWPKDACINRFFFRLLKKDIKI